MLSVLKQLGLLLISLVISQLVMYYFLDELIVYITSSSLVFIISRLFLAFIIWIILFILTSNKERRKIYIPNKLLILLYTLYTIFLISITLFKFDGISRSYNLIPLKSIMDFAEVNTNIMFLNLAANSFMFLPLGIIAYYWNKKTFNSLQIIIYTSLGIECLQFILNKGIFDINDLILNTIGGLIGIIVTKYFITKWFTINNTYS